MKLKRRKRVPIYMTYVIKAIKELNEQDGSTLENIMEKILKNSIQTDLVTSLIEYEIKKALVYGVRQGVLTEDDGKYKINPRAKIIISDTPSDVDQKIVKARNNINKKCSRNTFGNVLKRTKKDFYIYPKKSKCCKKRSSVSPSITITTNEKYYSTATLTTDTTLTNYSRSRPYYNPLKHKRRKRAKSIDSQSIKSNETVSSYSSIISKKRKKRRIRQKPTKKRKIAHYKFDDIKKTNKQKTKHEVYELKKSAKEKKNYRKYKKKVEKKLQKVGPSSKNDDLRKVPPTVPPIFYWSTDDLSNDRDDDDDDKK